ncbi:MAG: cytochrome b N-terminal domain-containing protein [Acidobacteriota bacterium]
MMPTQSKPDESPQTVPRSQGSRLFRWIDRRTGLNKLLHEALDEPIPGGARYAYIFGSGLLFIFLSQFITGIFLALYYVPSADHAHVTVAYITKMVAAGAFLRSLHVYGASAMVIIVILHLTQTFMYGSYKGRRELLWVSGTILFTLVMGMAFTGYLLPWDQKSYFATAVGTSVASEFPLVGGFVERLMRGGTQIGTLTLSRFYVMHVFYIPATIFLFVAIHIYLFRKAGAAGPVSESPVKPRQKTESFYPRQLVMDLGFALLLVVALGFAAYFDPASLGPLANPADTHYLPRPEWYFRPLFEWLKIWQGKAEFIRIVIIPAMIVLLFVGLPFIDRRLERKPWRRPVAVGTVSLVFIALISLGDYSYYQDSSDKDIAAQLAQQHHMEVQFMEQPFKPQMVGKAKPAPTATPSAAAGPLVAEGKKIFNSHGCYACHGQGGVGTSFAPKLIGFGKKFSTDQMVNLFKNPLPQMNAGGMPHFTFTPDQVKALRAYLDSLQ